MRNFIVSLFLFASLSSFAQTMPTANGDILTYEVFDAKQGFLQTEITFQPYKPGRTLKLNIESNGERSYTFLNGRPFAIYDKSFIRTSIRGVAVSPGEYFVLLPKDKKLKQARNGSFLAQAMATPAETGKVTTFQWQKKVLKLHSVLMGKIPL